MKAQFNVSFHDIISVKNLLEAWKEFVKGKRTKRDVQQFSLHLMDNILALHRDLASKTYQHGGYHAFNINDPKPRNIHKASARDRLLHHALHRQLCPFFDRIFIADSFSCRLNKGTHKALNRFRSFAFIVSKNNTKTCWILKCDIKKFFANINHQVLLDILNQHISDRDIIWLLNQVIQSFHSSKLGIGLPLGNLTSQLLVNIYLNEFDQFVKHKLKARYYIRYCDDFVILSEKKCSLAEKLSLAAKFLYDELKLQLHPAKIFIKTFASGLDFLGWVHFPGHRVLRTATKRRLLRKVWLNPLQPTVQSYLGLLKHGNGHKIKESNLCTLPTPLF